MDPDEYIELSLVEADEIPSYLIVIVSLAIFHFGSKLDLDDATDGRARWLQLVVTVLWFILIFISGLTVAFSVLFGFFHGLPWSIALVYWIFRAKREDGSPE